ncbi:MAG: glycoside hydrolase family 16 [Chitinophagaceae bacterium]|nr:glycoside hydrolase family 16 [Chitinophagaceae bacterium]
MKRFLSTAFLFILFVSASFAQTLNPCAQLVWQDEFDETSLDLTKWTPTIGDGCDIGLCGWGNNELEYYTDRTDNVKIEGGNLVITALKESYSGSNYTSGKITSLHQGDFTFGRIEARIKLPKGAGSWPAFWMLSSNQEYGPWPASGELDIMEYEGKDPNAIAGTVHYGTSLSDHKYNGQQYNLPASANYYDDFHIFTLDWDSTSVKWYMDGTLYHTVTKDDINPYHWPFDKPFYIILNHAVGGDLGGTVDDSSMPQTMQVDYIRVYSDPSNFNILGHQQLFVNASNEKYYVPPVSGATDYQWSVPTGATIASGQGTASILVNWGGTSSAGNVSLSVIQSCGSIDLVLPVRLLDDNSCKIILDDMNGNTNVTYDSWTSSTFSPSANNPSPVVNTSTKAGYLFKSPATGGNQVVLGNLPINDFSVYESGQRVLYMDAYTNGTPELTVELRFMNKAKVAGGSYPAGIRTVLKAKTTALRKWETLVFKFDRVEDATTLLSEIDQIAIVFNPEQTVAKYIYFDNLRRGLLPYNDITGDEAPTACDVSNETYSVVNNSSSVYSWSVPTGTTINSGQSTHQISVNWGSVVLGKVYLTETLAGCTDYTGSLDVKIVSCPTAIIGITSRIQTLEMYPNPSRDQVTITCDLPAPTDVKLVVTSSLGETLITKTYTGQSGTFSQQLSLQELKPGSYVLQLLTGSDIRSSQLIKY